MNAMTPEARRARIAELRAELAKLLDQEHAACFMDVSYVKAECRAMKSSGQAVAAVKHYRDKVGCGLREAHDVVMAM